MKRYAIIAWNRSDTASRIQAYLYASYQLAAEEPVEWDMTRWWVIEGSDDHGFTLDALLDRLASGLHFGKEIDLSHPIMKQIPEQRRS